MKTLNNIPTVSVFEMIEILLGYYVACVKKGVSFAGIPASFLWGPPGVGKSQAVKQFTECLEEETGKKCILKDIRVMLFDPVTLGGLPAVDIKKQLAVWLKPQMFDLASGKDVINVVFLDELSSAPPDVQKVALQMVLDRAIGEFKFPNNTIIIAAGNRVTDRCGAYTMNKALANRFLHYEIKTSFESWEKFAVENHVHELVTGYLKFDHSKLNECDVPAEQTAFATPRSWEFVSNILKIRDDVKNIKILYPQIAAAVGTATALEFIAWCNTLGDIPDVDAIFEGKKAKYPANSDELYKLIQRIVVLAKEKNEKGEFLSSYAGNIVRYAMKLPKDFIACLFLDLSREEEIRKKLWENHMYREWMKKNGVV